MIIIAAHSLCGSRLSPASLRTLSSDQPENPVARKRSRMSPLTITTVGIETIPDDAPAIALHIRTTATRLAVIFPKLCGISGWNRLIIWTIGQVVVGYSKGQSLYLFHVVLW